MSAYRVLRRLSTGGPHFRVHAGRELSTDRPVLLKQLVELPVSTDRLLEHFRAARGPALPPLLALGTSSEGLWAVCEGADGESLRFLMTSLSKGSGFIKPNEGLAVVTRVAAALEALHRQSLLHGDVCPSTVFLTASGEVHLHGAGVAAGLSPHPEEGPWRSEAGFLAPEQLDGPPTARSDVFRLGLMLYELAMGRPLWSGPTPAHLHHAVATFKGVPREKLKHVPEPWQSLLASTLAADPGERPSMQEVTLALEDGLRRAGWATSDDELALLLARGAPRRTSSFEPEDGAPQLLHLTPLGGSPPHGTPAVVARIATRKMTREMVAVKRPDTPSQPLPAVAVDDRIEVRVANLLIERGRLTSAQLQAAQAHAAASGCSLARSLVSQHAVDEDSVVAAAAELTKTPSLTAKKLLETSCPQDALALVPRALAQASRAVPLGLKNGTQLLVAMVDPLDAAALDPLKAAVAPKTVVAVRAGEQAIETALARWYAPGHELSARLIDALLAAQGQRGVQAQQLIALVAALARRMNLSAEETAAATAAARTMVAGALAMGRLAHDVPKLADLHEKLGCATDADACIEALHAFPGKLPATPCGRAVVLAFAFAAHAGEPRPSSSRLGGALNRFRTEVPVPPALFELLMAELARG